MAHTACSGRSYGRSSPTECRNLSHWQSYTSVRLPGTVQMRKGNNRAEQMFRLAANSLHHNNRPLGEYLRRMKAKLGTAGAITATARKIAIIFYTMVKNQVEYDATLWAQRDAQREKRFEEKLKRQAHQRGYKLVPIEQNPPRKALIYKVQQRSSSRGDGLSHGCHWLSLSMM